VRVPAWSARVPVQQSWRGCVRRGLAGRWPGAHRRSWASAQAGPTADLALDLAFRNRLVPADPPGVRRASSTYAMAG